MKAESDYVSYIRDGVRCFVSATLRKEMYMCDGKLWKESNTKLSTFKGKYRQTFIAINFKKRVVTSRLCREMEVDEQNPILFNEVLEVTRLELDVFKGEHK